MTFFGALLRSREGRGRQAAPEVLVDSHSLTHCHMDTEYNLTKHNNNNVI